jgi:cob(I)alamin adenosyltransferase
MVQLNRIYTKSGDKGESSLVSGERVAKSSIRFDAIGDIDELNSYIGLINTLESKATSDVNSSYYSCFSKFLPEIQNCLFDIGCLLAISDGSDWKESVRSIKNKDVEEIEKNIDFCNERLTDLDSFVLAGGEELNAHLHVARTICRRAERTIWKLNEESPVDEMVLKYVNRLSDFLFVYARYSTQRVGGREYLWDSKRE